MLPSSLPKKEAPFCDVLSELPEVRLLSPPSPSLKEEALHHVALRRWRRSCGRSDKGVNPTASTWNHCSYLQMCR